MSTLNYNAGLDSSNVVVSYAVEATWATLPTAVFQQIRLTAEDFTESKTRLRPLEIVPLGYAAQAITTKVESKGSLSFGLSYGTFDDFLVGALNSPGWSNFGQLVGAGSGDFAVVSGSSEITSTVTSRFAQITPGSRVTLAGFTNSANNGQFTVDSITAGASPVMVLYKLGTTTLATLVTETAPIGATITINSIKSTAGDITITNGTNILSSATSGKFTNIVAGQWILLSGFTNAANNGAFLVSVKTSATSLTLVNATGTQAFVTETPTGANAQITGSFIQNSNIVTTYSIEKQMATALYFQYLGSYVSSLKLTMEVGKYVEGEFEFLVKNQVAATTEAGTAAPLPITTGRIIDNISGFSAFAVSGAAPAATLQSIELTVTKERSASQYGIGSAAAVGMRRGTLQVDGKLSLFFLNDTYYNDFVSEAALGVTWQLTDNLGNAYVFTLPAITIMNPSIVAKGIDQDIIADFTLEGNPAPGTNTLYPAITIQIDRLPIS